MKSIRFCFFLFLILPVFSYSLIQKDCERKKEIAGKEEKYAEQHLKKAEKLTSLQMLERENCFYEAIKNYNKEIELYREIYNGLEAKRVELAKKQKVPPNWWAKSWLAWAPVVIQKADEKIKAIHQKWIQDFTHFKNQKESEIQAQFHIHATAMKEAESLVGTEKIPFLEKGMEGIQIATLKQEELLHRINELKTKDFPTPLEEYKTNIENSLVSLRTERQNLYVSKAGLLFEESKQKAQEAQNLQASPYLLNEVDLGVSNLKKAGELFAKAATQCQEALNTISSFPLEEEKKNLRDSTLQMQACAAKCNEEAKKLPQTLQDRKVQLKKKWDLFIVEKEALEEKGLLRASFALQSRMLPIARQLADCKEIDPQEVAFLEENLAFFATVQDALRLTDNDPLGSWEEFAVRENARRKHFYTNYPFAVEKLGSKFSHNTQDLVVYESSGIPCEQEKAFLLHAEESYRFVVESKDPISRLFIKVYDEDKIVQEEEIFLPQRMDSSWQNYLLKSGMVLIPEGKFKSLYGVDLRIRMASDLEEKTSFVIEQKTKESNYRFSISTENTLLYQFSVQPGLLWQLASLSRFPIPEDRPLKKAELEIDGTALSKESTQKEEVSIPTLDAFVQDLKKDPLLLAQYVHNEIQLVEPFLHKEGGAFVAPPVHRGLLATFLEKQGSPWEQCRLLVYLLRKAGYEAEFVQGKSVTSSSFAEKLLGIKIPEKEALFSYPWVRLNTGKGWVSLFPWMKEIQVREGKDLYSFLPEKYASAHRFIQQYLMSDEAILRHIGPDGDDTLGTLFVRFLQEELRKKGLSLQDVGITQTVVKKQISSWEDFPSPIQKEPQQAFSHVPESLFAKVSLQVFSAENPNKRLDISHDLTDLDSDIYSIRFSSEAENHTLHLQFGSQNEHQLALDPSDQIIHLKVSYDAPFANKMTQKEQTLSIVKGTSAALCFHFGGVSTKNMTESFNRHIHAEPNERQIHSLLSFVGTSYFERCCSSQKILANLHKVTPRTIFAFGLAKLSPDTSKGPVKDPSDLKFPQVDMLWFNADSEQPLSVDMQQFLALACVDQSSKEHQILQHTFQDPYAVSTVKLLQLAHLEHKKQDLPGLGFLMVSAESLQELDNSENAEKNHFSHLKEFSFSEFKENAHSQWEVLASALKKNPESVNLDQDYAYAYMTPSLVSSQDGTELKAPFYKGMGTLIIHPRKSHALISDQSRLLHGGFGSDNSPNAALNQFLLASPQVQVNQTTATPLTMKMDSLFSSLRALSPQNPSSFSFKDPFQAPMHQNVSRVVTAPMPNAFIGNMVPNFAIPGSFTNYLMTNHFGFNSHVSNPLLYTSTAAASPSRMQPIGLYKWGFEHGMQATSQLQRGVALQQSSLKQGQAVSPVFKPPFLRADVRPEHKASFNLVADPVDVVTGAFYIDEVDLFLPGIFPLEIRRNYNNQNLLPGIIGYGWKLSLNPFLIKKDDKYYAAETDGTVLVYRHNPEKKKWEVLPQDNPDLWNFTQKGIGGRANPFLNYIVEEESQAILQGADGSKRTFESSLLKKWVDHADNTLTFIYKDNLLERIESSSDTYLQFAYDHEKRIESIQAKDGRIVSYKYDMAGNLAEVKLPNDSVICYEYDHFHQIIRETKPHGRVLENIYDEEGRVVEQRSPVGIEGKIIPNAFFSYLENEGDEDYQITTVKDASGATTTYKSFKKQLYKILDPLGYVTLQSWFLDEQTLFDAKQEKSISWDVPGSASRCLYSSVDKRGLTTTYIYDKKGNPTEITLEGEDLTGKKEGKIVKKFQYSDQNLCIVEEVLSRKTVTSYDDVLIYLPKRIEKYYQDTLLSFVNLEYTKQGQLKTKQEKESLTRYEYDHRGFQTKIIQVTGTQDPDIVTEFAYNNKGQWIEKITSDGKEKREYDTTGNLFWSEVRSHSENILSSIHYEYNENNQLFLQKGIYANDVTSYDYNPSGAIKALQKVIGPEGKVATTLYEYDACGYLIEEFDPFRIPTYRKYDALGRVISVTKAGHTTTFSYEAGGLEESSTSPSGAKTTKYYTTNGLLKKEIYPDGTERSLVYDFFGRITEETKNGITWQYFYDDANNTLTKVHTETGRFEFQEFDERGNLLKLTDMAAAVWTSTYDGLNRLKSKTSPNGEVTSWNYEGDTVICTLPNGEKTIEKYEAGTVVSRKVYDAKSTLLAESSFYFDAANNMQYKTEGDITTVTQLNTLNLPVLIKQGDIVTQHTYDLCGHLLSSTDGDGHTTTQTYDDLGRIAEKILPDGTRLGYEYDLDSHLIAYHLPGEITWVASYDEMGRKVREQLKAHGDTSQSWNYTYEEGYLTQKEDPAGRIHKYLYDSQGRLVEESVQGCRRFYEYDPRGLLLSAEEQGKDHSVVRRSYDASGRLKKELIFLNSHLLQQTEQTWTPIGRSLQIGDHRRDLFYRNDKLSEIVSGNIQLSYSYDLGGLLVNRRGPLSQSTLQYNDSALPEQIHTRVANQTYAETLSWTSSGKLSSFNENGILKRFKYSSRGQLLASDKENYEFDFADQGLGIRTAAPNWEALELDAFGKVSQEEILGLRTYSDYDEMGHLASYNRKELRYDVWGRLIEFYADMYTWKASYDALGRRLQTVYVSQGEKTVTTSYYDPEGEFSEIGIQCNGKTFWKLYGPTSCDAVLDETGSYAQIVHNTLQNQVAVITSQELVWNRDIPSAYGPQGYFQSKENSLIGFASSLTWQSKTQDPTGLIWMGARYYDPSTGRFITPDPVTYPACLDLYTYANGDPINYHDPDGRFSSAVFDKIGSTVINMISPMHSTEYHMGKSIASGELFTKNAAGGSLHASIDFAANNLNDFFKISLHRGLSEMGFNPFDRGQIIQSAERSHLNQLASIENFMRGNFSFDLYSSEYQTFRYGTSVTLEVAALVYGGYGLVKGAITIPRLARLPMKVSEFAAGNLNSHIFQLEGEINSWLGKGTKMIKNKAGDTVFLSQDGLRKVRFDFINPDPHINPHGHVEELIKGKWNKSGPIFPVDVPNH